MRVTSPEVKEVADRSRELVAADRLEENAELLRDAVERFPDDAEVHLLAAAAARSVGAHEEGERLTRRAGELAWDDPHRLTWAASQMLDIGEVDEAQAWIRRIHEIVPDDFEMAADLAHLVGRLAWARGQEKEAEQMLRAAYDLDPDTPAHGQVLEELLERTGVRLRSTLRALRAGEGSVYDVRDALHGADVYVPHSGSPGETEITLVTMGDDDETIPLFSSMETMTESLGPEQAHLHVPFTELVAGWPEGVDAVVDPGSEWSLRLPAHTLVRPH
jgi:tetratricopeptide (TPR) repeat protein